MPKKSYKTSENTPMTVNEPAAAYKTAISEISSSNEWNPNIPFHGTQEEWWEHFHRIEEGNFITWEEHQKKFNAWKKEFLSNRM
jgi:hypothetical protein